MTREQKYEDQMRKEGTWKDLFSPAVHTLSIMEREHQRTLKEWKAEGSQTDSDLYAVIVQQRRDILSHRDALGLTPKGLNRLKKSAGAEAEAPAELSVLDQIRAKRADA